MKQRIFLSVLAIASFVLSATAQDEKPLFVSAGSFQNITIAGNMKVILMEAPFGENTLTVDKEASDKLKLTLSQGTLVISQQKQLSKNQVVYLLVRQLSRLNIEQEIAVRTNGILNTSKLDVFVDKGSTAHLKSNGKINVHPYDDNEIEVRQISPVN